METLVGNGNALAKSENRWIFGILQLKS